VFNPSDDYIDMTGNFDALIKRVVAVAGDTVEVKDRKLFVNGLEQTEPYINEQSDYTLPLQVVPAGMLMMLGDNRNHSFDSHVWGYLPQENVIGRAVVKYWPPLRMGFVEGSH
jgi:signal peptidase I